MIRAEDDGGWEVVVGNERVWSSGGRDWRVISGRLIFVKQRFRFLPSVLGILRKRERKEWDKSSGATVSALTIYMLEREGETARATTAVKRLGI